jgi:hypothetical protein
LRNLLPKRGNQKWEPKSGEEWMEATRKIKFVQDAKLLPMTGIYKSSYRTFMNKRCITAIAKNQDRTSINWGGMRIPLLHPHEGNVLEHCEEG